MFFWVILFINKTKTKFDLCWRNTHRRRWFPVEVISSSGMLKIEITLQQLNSHIARNVFNTVDYVLTTAAMHVWRNNVTIKTINAVSFSIFCFTSVWSLSIFLYLRVEWKHEQRVGHACVVDWRELVNRKLFQVTFYMETGYWIIWRFSFLIQSNAVLVFSRWFIIFRNEMCNSIETKSWIEIIGKICRLQVASFIKFRLVIGK